MTLFEKLWARHEITVTPDESSLLYIDRHLINEVTSPQAFEGLRSLRRQPWRASSVLATADHNIPTSNRMTMHNRSAQEQLNALYRNCDEFALRLYPLEDPRQGILHVVAPEQGETLPGTTIVCGDSHTSTHGAFATLALGIGTSDIEHVLATQTLMIKRLKTMRVQVKGSLPQGTSAKDIALYFISRFGSDCATGYAIEFCGEVISGMDMESRMTLCNMSVEAGGRCGLIAVDDTTLDYLYGRPASPKGFEWEAAASYWRTLKSDAKASFDQVLTLDVSSLQPFVTWGTSPSMAVTINSQVPTPDDEPDSERRKAAIRALDYMGLAPGTPIRDISLDKIFIGSCTNSRIQDLRVAAKVLKGRKIASNIKQALVVPGSGQVKVEAEREGLDKIFIEAGFEWREPGCSMCLGMNNDSLSDGERCASTSNRNFENRQGKGGRSHLVSPLVAAIAAIEGHFLSPEEFK